MAVDLQQRITSIQAKALVLAERYEAMRARLARAEESVRMLTAALAEREATIATLQSELGYLKKSTALAPAGADVEQTRQMISELVREIDKCIRDLSD